MGTIIAVAIAGLCAARIARIIVTQGVATPSETATALSAFGRRGQS